MIISTGLAGRAAVGAAPHGLPRPPAGRAARRRHGRLLRHADPRQRARGQRGRSTASTTSAADVVTDARRADPRLRPRLSGGDQADAQPDPAALRDADARRLQALSCTAELAEAVGVDPRRTSSASRTASPLEIDAKGARFGEQRAGGMIFVDGVEIGDVADVALRDRRMLSADGIFIVVATVCAQDGSSVVRARGARPRRAVPRRQRRASSRSCARRSRTRSTAPPSSTSRRSSRPAAMLHDDLAGFIYDRLKRRPMVLPVVVEV